jgi:predicted aspartyl protease
LFPSQPQGEPIEIAVWIDTAFTGDLVLPRSMISQLALKKVSNVDAGLRLTVDYASHEVGIEWPA